MTSGNPAEQVKFGEDKMNSEELVGLMKTENLNVKRVSTILSVTPTTVYRWIKGTRRIPDRVSTSIALRLKNRPRYLTFSDKWEVEPANG